MQPNSYFIKISGKINIPEKMELDKNYLISLNCSVTADSKVTNQDGTYDVIYKVEPQTGEILKDNGQIIQAKDIRRNSVKIRNSLYKAFQSLTDPIEFDILYDKVTAWVVFRMDSIVEDVIK